MFPITLEFKDEYFATCQPPCYGFLRNVEWDDWDQRFHIGRLSLKNVRRQRLYSMEDITDARPFGSNALATTVDPEEDQTPSQLFDLKDLQVIWNTGARTPVEIFVEYEDAEPKAWRWPGENSSSTVYHKEELMGERSSSPLESFNKSHSGHSLTLEKVLTDLEKAIDKDRESVLRFRDDGYGPILGVSTVGTPCDRVLFYLMVGRELDGYYPSIKMQTFLELHYLTGVPIMVAFMASRILAYRSTNLTGGVEYVGYSGDSCILPSQNFWVGCAARFKQPTAIEWEQHPYSSGRGHDRDDDMCSFSMEPEIEGFGSVYEEFNESMFNAVFGGITDSKTGILHDRPGGEKVANLVCELFRAITTECYYRNRGSTGYCSYWTCENGLQEDMSSSSRCYEVKNDFWMDKLLSLLTEE